MTEKKVEYGTEEIVQDETKDKVQYDTEEFLQIQRNLFQQGKINRNKPYTVNDAITVLGIATVASTFTQPFDLVQTRLQTHTAQAIHNNSFVPKRGIVKEFATIYKQQGFFKGMYRGFTPLLFTTLSGFFVYSILVNNRETTKNKIAVLTGLSIVSHPILLIRDQYVVLPTLTAKTIVPRSRYPDLMKNMIARRTFFTGWGMYLIGTISETVGKDTDKFDLEKKKAQTYKALSIIGFPLLGYPCFTIASNQHVLALTKKVSAIDVAKHIFTIRGLRGFYDGFFCEIGKISVFGLGTGLLMLAFMAASKPE